MSVDTGRNTAIPANPLPGCMIEDPTNQIVIVDFDAHAELHCPADMSEDRFEWVGAWLRGRGWRLRSIEPMRDDLLIVLTVGPPA